ncbi:MAG: endonuclease/exonuclease/phosphatase family protein [Bacteroidia bacterium]
MKCWSSIVFCIFFISACGTLRKPAAEPEEQFILHQKRVVSYNVENLFDTLNAPRKSDGAFTPGSDHNWNTKRYQAKLEKLADVISWSGEEVPILLIGLAEVENQEVVEDLLKTGSLATRPFALIHEESPDNRGIDVALAYDSTLFRSLAHQAIEVRFPFDPDKNTRDILYVKGIVNELDTLHIFVNHWPSRWGGEEASRPRRIRAAEVLRLKLDSLFAINAETQIIIMGDFNDEPTDHSLYATLKATGQDEWLSAASLYNFMYPLQQQGLGSYNYRGNWNMLDQIIVSGILKSNSDSTAIRATKAGVFSRKEMMYGSDSTNLRPNRTYGGSKYFGGYSDHLPVYLDIEIRQRRDAE